MYVCACVCLLFFDLGEVGRSMYSLSSLSVCEVRASAQESRELRNPPHLEYAMSLKMGLEPK